MSSFRCNKSGKPKKLYSEAYRYQELGAFMLAYRAQARIEEGGAK